jgi:hypothetical protein
LGVPHRFLEKLSDIDDFALLLGGLKLPLTVEWVQGRDRTSQQNKLMWLWASEAADQRGDVTADYVQREWKLNHGIPILCDDSEEYRSFCTLTLKRLSYEERVEAMRFTPVTSEMKVKQMVKFMDEVERECVGQGIKLTAPDPDLAAHQARNRTSDRKAA